MTLFESMQEYARERRLFKASDSDTPYLGHGLSLFHASLIESGLSFTGPREAARLSASSSEINSSHISHFIVAFLPFNSVTEKNEINTVLFEVYSFFNWLKKKGIAHGLAEFNIMNLVKDLCSMQERCLKLSHMLDDESGRTLEDPPEIVQTVTDIFSVEKIEKDFVSLKGTTQGDVVRLNLPPQILGLVELKDNLDLILGDTSDRWVLLEAGQVFPAYRPA